MLAVTESGGGIAGDPAAVEAAATTLRTAATDFGDTADDITSHGRAVTAEWTGTASDAAADAITRLSTRTRVGDDVNAAAAKVLDTYAASLRAAQSAHAAAATAATSAASAQASARSDLTTAQAMSSQTSAQADARTTATTTATTALSTADQAASSAADATSDALAAAAAADAQAAAAIDALVAQLAGMTGIHTPAATTATTTAHTAHTASHHTSGHESHHSGGWLHDAWSWTEDHASDISAIAGTAAFVTAFIPGVDVIATPILTGVAVAAGTVATVHDVQEGQNGRAVEDGAFTILNAVPGVGAVKALSKLDDAGRLLEAADEAAPAAREMTNSQHAALLDRNMRAEGQVKPPESATHHIVASLDARAEPARQVLAAHGVDIDETGNGVYLPRNTTSVGHGTGPSTHSTLHTDAYHAAVNDALLDASSREDVLEVLSATRDDLSNGWAPR